MAPRIHKLRIGGDEDWDAQEAQGAGVWPGSAVIAHINVHARFDCLGGHRVSSCSWRIYRRDVARVASVAALQEHLWALVDDLVSKATDEQIGAFSADAHHVHRGEDGTDTRLSMKCFRMTVAGAARDRRQHGITSLNRKRDVA